MLVEMVCISKKTELVTSCKNSKASNICKCSKATVSLNASLFTWITAVLERVDSTHSSCDAIRQMSGRKRERERKRGIVKGKVLEISIPQSCFTTATAKDTSRAPLHTHTPSFLIANGALPVCPLSHLQTAITNTHQHKYSLAQSSSLSIYIQMRS